MTSIKKTITISQLNNSGEGISIEGGETILAPFTLPGEVVEVSLESSSGSRESQVKRGTLKKIFVESTHRQKPPCPYFGRCGGCQLQHLDLETYKSYKKRLVEEAFAAHHLKGIILDPVLFGPGLRRRINFKAVKQANKVLLGYHQRRSHEVLDITSCPLLLPEFNSLLAPLKEALTFCLKERGEANIFLTKVSNGFDGTIVFDQTNPLLPSSITPLRQWAIESQVIRLLLKFSKTEDLLVHAISPEVNFSGFPVLFPSHAFLQTSTEAEDHMVKIVSSLLPERVKRILDLFSGLGTFSFPLTRYGRVDAVEGDVKAVQYLNLSAQKSKLSHLVQATQRDLFKYPLSEEELNRYDVVVLDPPRAGAVHQIKNLMSSSVKTVILISCNAHTFARDAQLLQKGGYQMGETHLVDQFLWSPHIELISSFRKD